MSKLTDQQIVAHILDDPSTLDQRTESTLMNLWVLHCQRESLYQPIRELVRSALSRRLYGASPLQGQMKEYRPIPPGINQLISTRITAHHHV